MTAAFTVRVPLLAFTAAYHRAIVEVLFGGRFLEYSYLLPMTALFAIGFVINVPVTLVAQAQEKAQFVLASKVFGLVGIAGSLLLIPVMGGLGAVIAGGTSILMKNLFIWWFVRDLARWHNAGRFAWRAVLIWGGFALAVLLQQPWVTGQPTLDLATGLVIWSAFFLLQIRAAASADERRTVGDLFSGRERKLLRLSESPEAQTVILRCVMNCSAIRDPRRVAGCAQRRLGFHDAERRTFPVERRGDTRVLAAKIAERDIRAWSQFQHLASRVRIRWVNAGAAEATGTCICPGGQMDKIIAAIYRFLRRLWLYAKRHNACSPLPIGSTTAEPSPTFHSMKECFRIVFVSKTIMQR